MELEKEEIDLKKYKKTYNEWLVKYKKNLFFITVFIIVVCVINYLFIKKEKLYLSLGMLYAVYLLYVTMLISYKYIYILKENIKKRKR